MPTFRIFPLACFKIRVIDLIFEKKINTIQSMLLAHSTNQNFLRIVIFSSILTLAIFNAENVHAQKLITKVYLEQNIIGLQKGFELGTTVFEKARIAYFFQATNSISLKEDDENYPFHGLDLSYPITSKVAKASFWINVRSGMLNGTTFIATPFLSTEINLFKHLNLGITTGFRAGHPSVGAFSSLFF